MASGFGKIISVGLCSVNSTIFSRSEVTYKSGVNAVTFVWKALTCVCVSTAVSCLSGLAVETMLPVYSSFFFYAMFFIE